MNLIEGLVAEIRRVSEIRSTYVGLGQPGIFGAALMKAELDIAQKAVAEEDVVQMVRSLESLKGFEE